MDESVICLEDQNEIIDLSDPSETTITFPSNSEHCPYEEFFIRERDTKRKCPKKGQGGCVIDLSEESDPESKSSSLQDTTSSGSRKSCDLSCPICFEKLLNVSVKATTCGHVFCSDCIESVVKETKSCPKCRKKLTMKNLIPLYL